MEASHPSQRVLSALWPPVAALLGFACLLGLAFLVVRGPAAAPEAAEAPRRLAPLLHLKEKINGRWWYADRDSEADEWEVRQGP